MNGKVKSKYAYCTLVMLGDEYVKGALMVGYSLKRVSKLDRVIMVTNDVSKSCISLLADVFTSVITVPYKKYKYVPWRSATKEQAVRYSKWIEYSFTKWNVLNLTKYKKILFLDADVVITRNIDAVFEFDAPAGVFNNAWKDCYRDLKIGQKIPHSRIDEVIQKGGGVLVASAVLLKPSKKDYKQIFQMLKRMEPFGFSKLISGSDEQAITYYYRMQNKQWTLLPPNLNTYPWILKALFYTKTIVCKDKLHDKKGNLTKCGLIKCSAPLIIHYFGIENVWKMDPWEKKYQEWIDIYLWWQLVYNYICLSKFKPHKIQKIKKLFKIKKRVCKDGISTKKICFYCKWLVEKENRKVRYDHAIIDEHNKLTCPRIKEC